MIVVPYCPAGYNKKNRRIKKYYWQEGRMKMQKFIPIIADVGSNHNGDLERAKELIRQAKNAGCYGVKFQLFKADKLIRDNSFESKEELSKSIKEIQKRELPIEWLPELKKEAVKNNIKFGCTAFDMESLHQIAVYVDFFKISSFDLLRLDLIRQAAIYHKERNITEPFIMSMGGATPDDVVAAVEVVEGEGIHNIMLLHCISNYPTKPEDCKLESISWWYGAMQDLSFGWSDHSANYAVCLRAASEGAAMIELHLDIDPLGGQRDSGWEFKNGHCWLPFQVISLNRLLRDFQLSGGVQELETGSMDRADPIDGLRPIRR